MKRLALVIAAMSLFTVGTAAQTFEVVPAPTCINNKGEQVIFTDRSGGGRADVAAGVAWRNKDGKAEVVRSNFQAATTDFQKFISLHECGHHQTGDVDIPHPPRNGPEHLYNEALSDCIAILRLRDEEAYDTDGLTRVTSAMRSDMARFGFPEISISSRISNIENCFKREGTARDLIDARLKQRGL